MQITERVSQIFAFWTIIRWRIVSSWYVFSTASAETGSDLSLLQPPRSRLPRTRRFSIRRRARRSAFPRKSLRSYASVNAL